MPAQTACAHCGVMFHPRYESKRRYCSVECVGLAKAKAEPGPALTAEERAVAAAIAADMEDALARLRDLLGEVER